VLDALQKTLYKLAWFVGSNSLSIADSLLCNPCFKDQFKKLTETEKGTWAFYDKKN
jgi:hypothetical protein